MRVVQRTERPRQQQRPRDGGPRREPPVRRGPPDAAAVAKAVRDLVVALGLDPDSRDLSQAPARVAEAWASELLDGYASDPDQVMAEWAPAPPGQGVVTLTRLPFRSMCPHHLLPALGHATIAYQPRQRLLGFSTVSRLLDTFSHRFALQEDVASQVVQALTAGLPAEGAGCIIESTQTCLSARGPEARVDARVISTAYAGSFETDAGLRLELQRAARRPSSEG
jgi:GTP cyclohydrolase I